MDQVLNIVIVVSVVMVCIFSVKRYIRKFGKGCCGSSEMKTKVKDKNESNYPYHLTLHVEGMHCSKCASRIVETFQARGNLMAKADFKSGVVQLYLKENLSDEKVKSIIEYLGYSLESIHR